MHVYNNVVYKEKEEMMLFKKRINDGSAPLKYKRGTRNKKEYKSKCLGYKFIIPDGFILGTEEQLNNRSKSSDIADLWGKSSSGVDVGVNVIPMDGDLLNIDDNTINTIGNAGANKINETSTDGRRCTYYGIREFIGKRCAHSIIEVKRNGIDFFTEFYSYYTPYYILQFAFTYTDENSMEINALKQAFEPL